MLARRFLMQDVKVLNKFQDKVGLYACVAFYAYGYEIAAVAFGSFAMTPYWGMG